MKKLSKVRHEVKNVISSTLPRLPDLPISPDEIEDNTDFGELGLSSRETCEVVIELEEKFRVNITDQEIPNANTPKRLAELIMKKKTQRARIFRES